MFTCDLHSLEYGDVLLCETRKDNNYTEQDYIDSLSTPPWCLFFFVAMIFIDNRYLVYGHWLELCANDKIIYLTQYEDMNNRSKEEPVSEIHFSLNSLFEIEEVSSSNMGDNLKQFHMLRDRFEIDISEMDYTNLLVAMTPFDADYVSDLSCTYIPPFQMNITSNQIPKTKRSTKKTPVNEDDEKSGSSTDDDNDLTNYNVRRKRRRKNKFIQKQMSSVSSRRDQYIVPVQTRRLLNYFHKESVSETFNISFDDDIV